MAQKTAIPKGTRDFLPKQVARRNYIFDTVRSVFRSYGFAPIETPSFELSATLLGKYGEEGDRLIFNILNSGDFLKTYSRVLRIHVRELFKQSILSLADRLNDNTNGVADKKIKILLSPDFAEEIIASLKEKKIEGFNEFHSKELFELLDLEVKNIRNDAFIIDRVVELINECKDCSPIEDNRMKRLIEELTDKLLGRWYSNIPTKYLTSNISEKALRYDLTVPFARFVVQHQNELSFPFKRYQIQPVWRADRPQASRYQEFFQCDADVVGSDSLLYEADFIQIFDKVLTQLNIPGFSILVNNRKILSGIAEVSGEAEKLIDITVAIDKLDKIGREGVENELREKGVSESAIAIIRPLFELSGSNREKLEIVRTLLKDSETGLKGIEELEFVLGMTEELGIERASVEFDVTLARGLNYYTGAIFEVKAHDSGIGSICGGGRYDDLTGVFGLKGVSGVGISFGADRIYDVLLKFGLFPETVDASVTLLFVNFGDNEARYCMKLAKKLRAAGVDCEVYPSSAKMQKQLKYANDTGVKYVALIGESELASGNLQVKHMESGEQQTLTEAELASFLTAAAR